MCVMALYRRPQVGLATEGLKCVDSGLGGINQGLERRKGDFLPFKSIIAFSVKFDSDFNCICKKKKMSHFVSFT